MTFDDIRHYQVYSHGMRDKGLALTPLFTVEQYRTVMHTLCMAVAASLLATQAQADRDGWRPPGLPAGLSAGEFLLTLLRQPELRESFGDALMGRRLLVPVGRNVTRPLLQLQFKLEELGRLCTPQTFAASIGLGKAGFKPLRRHVTQMLDPEHIFASTPSAAADMKAFAQLLPQIKRDVVPVEKLLSSVENDQALLVAR